MITKERVEEALDSGVSRRQVLKLFGSLLMAPAAAKLLVPKTIVSVPEGPFGTFAGGRWFPAEGVYIYNKIEGNSFTLLNANGKECRYQPDYEIPRDIPGMLRVYDHKRQG